MLGSEFLVLPTCRKPPCPYLRDHLMIKIKSALQRFQCGVLAPLVLFATCGFLLAAPAYADSDKAAKLYEDALRRYDKGDLPGASVQLKSAIQQNSKMLSAHLLLGKTLFKLGQLKGAEAAFEEALKLGVDRGEVALPLGQVYLLLGESKLVIDRIQPTGLSPALQAEILTLRGTAYAESGNSNLAARSFAEARTLNPKSPAPLIAEGSWLLKQGKQQEAMTLIKKAIELAPKDAQAWSTYASVLQAGQDVTGALAAYDRSLELDPRHAEARLSRAALLMSLNRGKEAEKDLSLLTEANLEDPRVFYLRAVLASERGDAAGAKALLAEATREIDALPKTYLSGKGHLLMVAALANHALRNWEKATEYLNLILERTPRNFVARKLLASIYIETKDYKRARTLLEKLLEATPDDSQVQFMLGSVYLVLRQHTQAAELLEKATHGGNPAAVHELGLSQLALGRDNIGIASLEKAFSGDIGDNWAGVELSIIYSRQGQLKKAVQVAETIVKREPSNLAMINFLGSVKGASGDKAGARAAYLQVLAKDPGFRPAILNLIRLDVEESHVDEARTRLNQLLAKRGDDPDALYEFGALEVKAKKTENAVRYWQKAIDVQRTDTRPGLALVDLLGRQGQTAQALTVAKQLASTYPDDLAVKVALGRALMAAGDLTSARSVFHSATLLANYDPTLQVQIGRLQLNAGNPDGAVYSAQKALQGLANDEAALTLMVEAETVRGETARAKTALKALADSHPNSLATLQTSANFAMTNGQYAAAANGYRAVLALQPTTATAINIVQAHVALGEYAKAITFLTDWLKKHTNDSTALKALAELQMRTGNYSAARKTYELVLAYEPDDTLSLNNLAIVLLNLNDPKASEIAEKAHKLVPNNSVVTDTLGWIMVRQGKAESGLGLLREARLRSPENSEIRFHLAYALARTGRKAEAKEELTAALNGPNKLKIQGEVSQLKTELGL